MLSFEDFQKNLMALTNKNNFMLDDLDIKSAFLATTRMQRTTGVSISIEDLTNRVYTALHAISADKMRESFNRHAKLPIIRLLEKNDNNKDGYLSYAEVENLFIDIKVTF